VRFPRSFWPHQAWATTGETPSFNPGPGKTCPSTKKKRWDKKKGVAILLQINSKIHATTMPRGYDTIRIFDEF
jgi:hypothetical protein